MLLHTVHTAAIIPPLGAPDYLQLGVKAVNIKTLALLSPAPVQCEVPGELFLTFYFTLSS